MKMKNTVMKILSVMMVIMLVYPPSVHANEFDEVCGPVLERMSGKKDASGGDQLLATCEQADLARQAKNWETAKSVIYGLGAAVCTAAIWMEYIPYTKVAAQAICTPTAIAAPAAGIAVDIAGKITMNSAREKYAMAKEQVCSVSTFTPLIMSAAPYAISAVSGTASTASTASAKTSCVMCAITLGLITALSISQAVSSNNAKNDLVDTSKKLKDAAEVSVKNFAAVQMNTQATLNTNTKPRTTTTTAGPSKDSCANESGNKYLSCVGQNVPEIAALTNSPEFMGTMDSVLKGKNLGDFVKGYKGDSPADLSKYIADNTGLNPALTAKAIDNSMKIGKESGFMDKYTPMTYNRGGGAPKKVGGPELDFSKMMAGLLGKLNPGEETGKKEDPSERVFRQLDLLPADKIEANKDISLFVRVAFRYRKNNTNVEQLNWSHPGNQQKK